MRNIYLDNATTSFPKAPGVAESMCDYINKIGASINRGAYAKSYQVENVIYETRELLCSLFNFNKAENVIFTKNITESLNVLLKGLFKRGDHVIVSSMEHNAVMRPLNALNQAGIKHSKVLCKKDGSLDANEILLAIEPATKGVVMTHCSNVSGTILNLEAVGKICNDQGLWFIIDSAQTAGVIDVDFEKFSADAIAFTGHKSLLGPQGIGGFILKDKLAANLSTLIEGGTGSLSDQEIQPPYLPDKFEAGTLNVPGIYGLHAALQYLEKVKIQQIYEKEMFLMSVFLEAVLNMQHIEVIGQKDLSNRTGIISLNFKFQDNAEIAHRLAVEGGIMVRSGMHCAPCAHVTLGTYPQGTVRFGFSHFLKEDEIRYVIDHLYKFK